MNSVIFYLLEKDCPDFFLAGLCRLITEQYHRGLRLYVLAKSKNQAEAIDEYLWQQELSDFVPHGLLGESKKNNPAVEIGWQGLRHSGIRQVLVNLTDSVATFAPSFPLVIDFVPSDENLKQKARERYKIYSMAGRQMHTQAITSLSK